MATMIRSSAHHAKSVELFKTRLRAGQAVDAMDDAGRWVRARIVQMDESWAKCNVKWEEGGQEEWIALQGDRVRPPGEMTHGAAGLHYAPPVSAAHAAHAAASRQLRKEALVLWLFAAMLLAGAALWSEGLTSWALLAAAAWTAWFGALPRTLRSVGETWKATLSETAVANHSTEGMQGVQSQWQFWKWLRPGCKVDFCNRSGQWVRGQVLLFPFPWRTARVEFVGASGRDATEWVGISEQRMLYPGQLTNAQDTQHRNATPQGDLSGTISSQLLERSTRSANADPHGHTPTSARLDGLRDGGGFARVRGRLNERHVLPGLHRRHALQPFCWQRRRRLPGHGRRFRRHAVRRCDTLSRPISEWIILRDAISDARRVCVTDECHDEPRFRARCQPQHFRRIRRPYL